jgi:hypothetical protein
VAPATAGALGAHPRRSTASSSPAARGAQPTSGGEGEAPLAGIIQAPTAYDGATDELALGHNSEQVLSAIKRSRESMSAAERAQWIDQAAQFGDRRAELEPMLLSELRAKGASEAPAAAEGDAPGAEAAAPGVGTSSGGNGSDRYLLQAHAHQSLMSLMDDPERAMSVTSEAMAENGDSPVLVDLVYRQFLRKFPAKEAELKGKLSSSGFDAESTDKLVSGNL